mmetsp:Transcript_35753/g.111609  ORF Transcript_35753/g.111609 Transcript_35753/m.111609 type:complete len:255 (-) Transcript_35753:92-856(-)
MVVAVQVQVRAVEVHPADAAQHSIPYLQVPEASHGRGRGRQANPPRVQLEVDARVCACGDKGPEAGADLGHRRGRGEVAIQQAILNGTLRGVGRVPGGRSAQLQGLREERLAEWQQVGDAMERVADKRATQRPPRPELRVPKHELLHLREVCGLGDTELRAQQLRSGHLARSVALVPLQRDLHCLGVEDFAEPHAVLVVQRCAVLAAVVHDLRQVEALQQRRERLDHAGPQGIQQEEPAAIRGQLHDADPAKAA